MNTSLGSNIAYKHIPKKQNTYRQECTIKYKSNNFMF